MERTYELYRSARGAPTFVHVTLNVTDDRLEIFDHSLGDGCEMFFGRDEIEHSVSVDEPGARKILRSMGEPGRKYPLDRLALELAERLEGNSKAASLFRTIAERAGVKPTVWTW